MRKRIEKVLLELGITPNLKGFEPICRAIELIIEKNPGAMDLYMEIAAENGRKYVQIERNIRIAIQKINRNDNSFAKYLNLPESTKLTNTAVLYALALNLKEEQ